MPIQLTGYASVEPTEIDLEKFFLASPQPTTHDRAVRALAKRYESAYRQEPRAASLIKAQWAWALLPGRAHACRPPKQVSGKIEAAELIGVYFGLYCNPPQKRVHEELKRTLADILREASADDGSILAVQLAELLQMQRPGGSLGQRAAIWGTKQDMSDLLDFLKNTQCGNVHQVRAMTQGCVQTAFEALLTYTQHRTRDAFFTALMQWSGNALTLIDNGALLKTYEQLDALALLAVFGHDLPLFDRLPPAAWAPRKLFASGEQRYTLVQWLLSQKNIHEQAKKLRFVLEHSDEPLWYAKGGRSPWLQSIDIDPSANLAIDMLGVVGPSHRDPHIGATPLHLMVSATNAPGAWSLLSALLLQGADPQARDHAGRTALYVLQDSPFAEAVRGFSAWYGATWEVIEVFCETVEQTPHVVVAPLLRHIDALDGHGAGRLLAVAIKLLRVSPHFLGPAHKLAFVQKAADWLWSKDHIEQQERLATLECAPSVPVAESIFECRRMLRGAEWRVLRMVLVHMQQGKTLGLDTRMVTEVMDDICTARKDRRRIDDIILAVSDFRSLPMQWFSASTTTRLPACYWAYYQMYELNKAHPGRAASSGFARMAKKCHHKKTLQEPRTPLLLVEDIDTIVWRVKEALESEGQKPTNPSVLTRFVDILTSKADFTPLFDDAWTAQAIDLPQAPQPAAAPSARQPLPFPQSAPGPDSVAQNVAVAASSDENLQGASPIEQPQIPELPRQPADHPLQAIVAQGIEPLLRDLRSGRLAETDLEPLRALAEALAAQTSLLRGAAPMFESALQALRTVAEAPTAPDAHQVASLARTASEVRREVALVSQVLHDELLMGVILGTTGIGETERMQRATKSLVGRTFVQVLARALGDEFALLYLSDDASARSAALRRMMFRAAPDKCIWAHKDPDVTQGVSELFQLVSGLKVLREQQTGLERVLVATLRRSSTR